MQDKGCEGVDWIQLAEGRNWCGVTVNTVKLFTIFLAFNGGPIHAVERALRMEGYSCSVMVWATEESSFDSRKRKEHYGCCSRIYALRRFNRHESRSGDGNYECI